MFQNSTFTSFSSLLKYSLLLDLTFKKSEVVLFNFLQIFVGILLWLELKAGHPSTSLGGSDTMDQCNLVTLYLSLRFMDGENGEPYTMLQRTGNGYFP